MRFEYVRVSGNKGRPGAHKNGLMLEHRLVMEQHIGRSLLRSEIVHHINGDTTDNRVSNLVITNPTEHNKLFHPQREAAMVSIACAFCGLISQKRARNVGFKQRAGQIDFYCNRTCAASHFGRGRKKV